MSKSLAQLKRDIKVGTKIELIEIREAWGKNEVLEPVPIKERIAGIGEVVKVQTNGFYVQRPNAARPSFCDYPKAKHVTYEGDTFTIGWHHPKLDKIVQERVYKIHNT